MAEKSTVDVSEFEKVHERIVEEENSADWKLAKSFEHTAAYRRIDNDSIFKVSYVYTYYQ